MTTASPDYTLAELFTRTAAKRKWSRLRRANTKTVIARVARGLGKSDPTLCTARDYTKPMEHLIYALNSTFSDKQSAFARTSRAIFRAFFNAAEERGFYAPVILLKKKMTAKAAEREMYQPPMRGKSEPYRIKLAEWPDSLQAWWAQWTSTFATPLRVVTCASALHAMECYVGFLQDTAKSRRDLYRRANVEAFIKWHGGRCYNGACLTVTAKWVLHTLSIGARSQAEKEAMRKMRHAFALAPPFHNKAREVNRLSLRKLEDVGLAMQHDARCIGMAWSQNEESRIRVHRQSASIFRDALILRLLVRVPMRQRCIREMRIGKNLINRNGRWVIHFQGEELKFDRRGNKENNWEVSFPADLCHDLQEYMHGMRPVLDNGQMTTLVFPNSRGKQLTGKGLHLKLASQVYQYLEKRFYPHLIRSIWPTEMAAADADIEAVTHMLNDRIETVLRAYYSRSSEKLQEKAERSLGAILERRSDTSGQMPRLTRVT